MVRIRFVLIRIFFAEFLAHFCIDSLDPAGALTRRNSNHFASFDQSNTSATTNYDIRCFGHTEEDLLELGNCTLLV